MDNVNKFLRLRFPLSLSYIYKLFMLFFVLGLPIESISQIVTRYDSMDLARNMMYSQRLPEAIYILEILNVKYPEEEIVKELYSQALYWNKDYNKTIAYIRSTDHPSPGLSFHYGNILFELDRLREAQFFLSSYLLSHQDDPEALLLLAKISYWQRGSTKGALNYIDQILGNDPLHAQALQFKEEIYQDIAPQVGLKAKYYNDSQTLQAMMYATRLSYYYNSWLQPSVQVNTNQYANGEQVLMANFSNRLVFPNTKTELGLTSGVFSNSWSNELTPTWSVSFKQKTLKNLFLTAEAGQTPYLFTLASIGQNIMPVSLATSLVKESGTGWTGSVTLQEWQFMDENKIRSLSSWVLFPIAQHPILSLNIGYAFIMANADHNRFTLEDPSVMPSTFGEVLPGVFDPYFTPQNQLVHAALAKIDINFSKKFRASLNSNIGIYATIDNPNFIYYGSTEPNSPSIGNGPVSRPIPNVPSTEYDGIYRILIPTKYFPIDISGRLVMELNRFFTLQTEWGYMSTIYFNSHTASIGLNWKFAKR